VKRADASKDGEESDVNTNAWLGAGWTTDGHDESVSMKDKADARNMAG
jgi:hypothetical protein